VGRRWKVPLPRNKERGVIREPERVGQSGIFSVGVAGCKRGAHVCEKANEVFVVVWVFERKSKRGCPDFIAVPFY
jgi:hypothetical protein